MSDEKNEKDSLDSRVNDTVVAVTKGALGAVPFVGSILSEVIGHLVPDQRLDRIADFLRELARRFEHLERELVMQSLTTPEGIDVLEDGIAAASRTLTSEQRRMLAGAFARALTATDIEHIYRKRLLKTITDIGEPELVMLHAIALRSRQPESTAFQETHEAVLRGPEYHFDRPLIDQKEYVRHEALIQHLVGLKLLSMYSNAKMLMGMSVPRLFEEGSWHANYEITPLGHDLLALTDLDAP